MVLVAVCGLTGVLGAGLGADRASCAARESRMLAELPTIAELLALAVGAGEGAVGALERVVRSTHGELTAELARTLADARAGAPLTVALDDLADRTGLPALARFAEGVAVAVERGTPLADVLRAQAQDVREEGRRALMETGGRKEVLMMVPVVFLILPITVVFAVFPEHGGPAGRSVTAAGSCTAPRRRPTKGVPMTTGPRVRRRSTDDRPTSRVGRRCGARWSWGRRRGGAGAGASGGRPERGDVPGWVLVTLMTAGLVTALWLVAGTRARPTCSRTRSTGVTGALTGEARVGDRRLRAGRRPGHGAVRRRCCS